MKVVAVTGASSFTGMSIASEFANTCRVFALVPKNREEYSGLKWDRLRLLDAHPNITVTGELCAENDMFPDWIRSHSPDIWVHHHHWMVDFNSRQYDLQRSLKIAIDPLEGIVSALKRCQCEVLILSGTYFEPGEGGTDSGSNASLYGLSKAKVSEELKRLCSREKLPFSKVVIPNPIGPREEASRLVPSIIHHARSGQTMQIRSGESVSDYLPMSNLAQCYFDLAQGSPRTTRPSGWITNVKNFIELVNAELVVKRLNWPSCRFSIGSEHATSFFNDPQEIQKISWSKFWDEYANYIQRNENL